MSVNSSTDVANLALGFLGAQAITDISEGSSRANLCQVFIGLATDEVLRAYDWNFARTRTTLAQDATAPVFGWAYSYQLPTDPYCLRVLGTDPEDAVYVIEGRKLLTDEAPMRIVYTRRVPGFTDWNALTVCALGYNLAMKIAWAVTRLPQTAQLMGAGYQQTLVEARTADSQEGSTVRAAIDDLVAVRSHPTDEDYRRIRLAGT